MKERFERVGARESGYRLPKFALKARFALVMIALAVLCVSALAQENTVGSWIKEGQDLVANQSYEEAIQAYDNALQIDPENADAWQGRGFALNSMAFYKNDSSKRTEANKSLEKALDLYNKKIETDPKDASTWLNKSYALRWLNRPEEALSTVDKAIELNPKYNDALGQRAELLAMMDKPEEAIKTLDNATAIDPTNIVAWKLKGLLLTNALGKHDESVQAFDKAIQLDPNDADSWNGKGDALKSLGRSSEADAAFAKAKNLGYLG